MNLLLLICMLQAWVLFSEFASTVVDDARTLGENLLFFQSMAQGVGTAQAYLSEYETARGAGPRWNPRQIRLSTIANVTDADLIASRPSDIDSLMRVRNANETDRAQIRESLAAAILTMSEKAQASLDRLQISIVESAPRLSGPEPTIFDLERVSRKEFDIPFVHGRVDAHPAFWILGFGSLAVLLILYSLVCSIRLVQTADRSGTDKLVVLDLLFLHPGRLPLVLGAIWVFIPSALLVIALGGSGFRIRTGTAQTWSLLVLTGLSMLLAALVIQCVVRIRRK